MVLLGGTSLTQFNLVGCRNFNHPLIFMTYDQPQRLGVLLEPIPGVIG